MADTFTALLMWGGAVSLGWFFGRFVWYVINDVPWRVVGIPRVLAALTLLCALAGVGSAFAARTVRAGWSEACIDGLQSYPESGVGTIGYCPNQDSTSPVPNASECTIFQAADYAGQSFSCPGPGTHFWSAVTVESLPAIDDGGDPPDVPPVAGYVVSWQDAAELSWLVAGCWALAFGVRLAGTALRTNSRADD